jgi:glycosyltransferase involved in cell wall biosynthesis
VIKIAVNTRLLLKDRLEGIGWFTYETLRRITIRQPETRFYFIFDRPWHRDFIFSENVIPIVAKPQARHPLLFYIWFEHSLPGIFKKIRPDLFFSPDGYLSLNADVPSVSVIHDLNFEHYPMDLPWLVRKYYRYYFPRFAHKAERIMTVSEYSRRDIHQRYGISKEKIDVVYNGANENFAPLTAEEISETRKKFSGGLPYFVFVGSLHPRKNLARLFAAFDRYRDSSPEKTRLVIAGTKKWWTSEIEKTYNNMKYRSDVLFTGRVPEHELNRIIGSALAMVYVSNFEGFGIPILEAFYCGVPVITSTVTSMPEVAGDAALFADPGSVDSIAEKMMAAASDEKLREELINKGFRRAELFTWERTADKVWESLMKASGQ